MGMNAFLIKNLVAGRLFWFQMTFGYLDPNPPLLIFLWRESEDAWPLTQKQRVGTWTVWALESPAPWEAFVSFNPEAGPFAKMVNLPESHAGAGRRGSQMPRGTAEPPRLKMSVAAPTDSALRGTTVLTSTSSRFPTWLNPAGESSHTRM